MTDRSLLHVLAPAGVVNTVVDFPETMDEVELSPIEKVGLSFAYDRNDAEYPNRPNRVPVVSGVPVAGVQFPVTPSGLLESGYDTYTVDFMFVPSEHAELGA